MGGHVFNDEPLARRHEHAPASLRVLTPTITLTPAPGPALGRTLSDSRPTLEKIAGITIIVMGVLFVIAMFVPMLNREWHVDALMHRSVRAIPAKAGAK